MRYFVATFLTLCLSFALGTTPASGHSWPTSFPLPNGFQPEGIAIGPGAHAYFGSRADGSIHRVDLRTGKGARFSQGPGTPSLGLKTDGRRLFVAGGTGGDARVIDLRSGRVLARHALAAPGFVNDVVLYRGAAWFTDSHNPVLYRVPLRHGTSPGRVPLSGDIVYGEGINANGIVPTPDRRALLLVQSNTGLLFRVDPRTGATKTVDLGAERLTFGDGLLLHGKTLYVVQNRLNAIAVVTMNAAGTAGKVERRITDPAFDIPTTVAAYGNRLYLPNARFTTPPTPDTPYNVVSVKRG